MKFFRTFDYSSYPNSKFPDFPSSPFDKFPDLSDPFFSDDFPKFPSRFTSFPSFDEIFKEFHSTTTAYDHFNECVRLYKITGDYNFGFSDYLKYHKFIKENSSVDTFSIGGFTFTKR